MDATNENKIRKKTKLKLCRDGKIEIRSKSFSDKSKPEEEFIPHEDFVIVKKKKSKNVSTQKQLPVNPYKKKTYRYKTLAVNGIRRKGSQSKWYLTNKNGRNLNYSFNFSGPVDDGDELILIRRIDHCRRVSWGQNQVFFYDSPEHYDPWEHVHKADSLIRILEPRKF